MEALEKLEELSDLIETFDDLSDEDKRLCFRLIWQIESEVEDNDSRDKVDELEIEVDELKERIEELEQENEPATVFDEMKSEIITRLLKNCDLQQLERIEKFAKTLFIAPRKYNPFIEA